MIYYHYKTLDWAFVKKKKRNKNEIGSVYLLFSLKNKDGRDSWDLANGSSESKMGWAETNGFF